MGGIAGWSFTDNGRMFPLRKPRDYDAELQALNDKAGASQAVGYWRIRRGMIWAIGRW